MMGKTIRHYEILEKLGEGGMGAVFKARDTHLDRFVALKLLLPEAVANPDRRRRFVQEAKAASALNHPNIIHIYDIDEADGVQFIAMEYVGGKTLDQLVGRKGLPLHEVLRYAVQMANGLTAGHAARILHRDLKPSNIMVNEQGLVKLLDFGLDKLAEHPLEETDATQTVRTDEKARTEEGTIVGTVAYMSPEQAQGRAVDERSDIFSFGAVGYEMVTGRRAFSGASRIATLSAILRDEPKAAGEIVESVPRDLDKILARCLRKDPGRRFQHMADLKVALEEVKEESESGKLAPLAPLPRKQNRSAWMVIGSVIVCAVVAGVFFIARRTAVPPAAHPLTRMTSDAGLSFEPALSRDGTLLAFASDRSGEGNLDIWVKQTAGSEPVRITRDTVDNHQPSFSPDGSKIAYRSERGRGGIYVVPALGGDPRRLVEGGRNPVFSPDGNWIAYWDNVQTAGRQVAIFVIPSGGGAPRQVAADFGMARSPVLAGDSRHLAFMGANPYPGRADLWVTPIDGGTPAPTDFRAAMAARNSRSCAKTSGS